MEFLTCSLVRYSGTRTISRPFADAYSIDDAETGKLCGDRAENPQRAMASFNAKLAQETQRKFLYSYAFLSPLKISTISISDGGPRTQSIESIWDRAALLKDEFLASIGKAGPFLFIPRP